MKGDKMRRDKPRIGFLPFYLKLYDDATPEKRQAFDPFLKQVEDGFIKRGIDVVRADVCRVASEFGKAVALFEESDVDCIVTLHMAYSPSLESLDSLLKASVPILILDTTMDDDFGQGVRANRIMFNHGIHGVMDMACMLRRHGKSFQIVAGHITKSNVMDRASDVIHGASATQNMKRTRALRIGESFKGMGDFSVDDGVMRDVLGVTVDQIGIDDLEREADRVSDDEIDRELNLDRERFNCDLPDDVHKRSLRVCLGVRTLLEGGDYSAFSMNFLAFDRSEGSANAVPFLEASKAMSRGIGYAGEGDILTASLVGALASGFGGTTFTEIFCPDWKGESLFLSHMGEVNPDFSVEPALLMEKPFPYTPARNPAVLACALGAGSAVFVNLAPAKNDAFTLIVSPVEVLGDSTDDDMKKSIRGWIKPNCGIKEFLETYSLCGGTHHSALVMGDRMEGIVAMAGFMGIECRII